MARAESATTKERARLRRGPSGASELLAELPPGTALDVLGESGGWKQGRARDGGSGAGVDVLGGGGAARHGRGDRSLRRPPAAAAARRSPAESAPSLGRRAAAPRRRRLCGSVPFGVLLARRAGVDPRVAGSGN